MTWNVSIPTNWFLKEFPQSICFAKNARSLHTSLISLIFRAGTCHISRLFRVFFDKWREQPQFLNACSSCTRSFPVTAPWSRFHFGCSLVNLLRGRKEVCLSCIFSFRSALANSHFFKWNLISQELSLLLSLSSLFHRDTRVAALRWKIGHFYPSPNVVDKFLFTPILPLSTRPVFIAERCDFHNCAFHDPPTRPS